MPTDRRRAVSRLRGGHGWVHDAAASRNAMEPLRTRAHMKLIVELVLSAILHPVAVILMWINLAGRSDIGRGKKVLWALLGLVWGIGPILYVLVGDGTLW